MKEVTCNNCGTVHFTLDLKTATDMISNSNEIRTNLKYPEDRLLTIDMYKLCKFCGNGYENFRDSIDSDAPRGVTLQPVLEYIK